MTWTEFERLTREQAEDLVALILHLIRENTETLDERRQRALERGRMA
jgi:hypothetical protein